MSDISKLEGLTLDEQDRLKKFNINTIDQLWARVGANYKDGLDQLDQQVGIKQERLIELLSKQGLLETDPSDTAWIRRHAFGLYWIGGVVVLALLLLGIRIALTEAIAQAYPPVVPVVAVGSHSLPAFHVITAKDVDIKLVPQVTGSFTTTNDVVGRYTLQALKPGMVLIGGHVTAACSGQIGGSPTERLSLPVNPATLRSVVPGSCVSLLLSPRQPGALGIGTIELSGVPVLAVDEHKEAVIMTIAVTGQGRDIIAPWLATSELFVLQQFP